ncbi:hypothetical protein LJC42_06785 [Eubacteriales bacterium OttesenSCG-928-K08]|nr:hypothetical protein [Eubacteriales bacterium OttesenSCG-928-K08]
MKASTIIKRLALVFLVFALLLLLGCANAQPEELIRVFLGHINAGDYGFAYELLHSSRRYDEAHAQKDLENNTAQSATRISKEQFEQRYANIFEALDISGFTYTVTNSVQGEVICVYDYTIQYNSPLIGEQSFDIRMSVLREDLQWTVEWSPALIFPEMDWGDTVRVGNVAATRGEILAEGVLYAQTASAISVLAYPEKITDPDHFARQVAVLLDMTVESVKKRIDSEHTFVIIKQLYPDEYSESLEAQLLDIEGISVDSRNFGTLRDNPQGNSLAHIVGYTGMANENDLERLTGSKEGNEIYNTDSRVGKTGLEQRYETELRGEDGYYIYIADSTGASKQTLYRKEVKNGLDIQLTIDPKLQATTEALLKYSLYGEDTAGAVIVLDPTTGRIDAMASYPDYDLNLFTRGISQADYAELEAMENKPFFNRLTQGRYPPGSIFKPFTAAAALEYGSMTTSTTFPENRGETIEEDTNGNDVRWRPSDTGEFGPWKWAYITRVSLRSRHRPLNMHNGMIDSDNIYFAYAALRTGTADFREYMDMLGFNSPIPFDLSVAAAQMASADAEWNPMLLAESAFGQGEVLMTPLQAAAAFGAFANGGTIMQPYIVEGLYRTQGTDYIAEYEHENSAWKQSAVSSSIVRTIEPMLQDVIDTGTGHTLQQEFFDTATGKYRRLKDIAGKTGTAQIGNDRSREINWFVGYRLNTNEPRLVLVMLELPANSAEFSNVKFDIARELLK